jgi:hypothetical protein
MRHIEQYWTRRLGWVAEVQPHVLDAPAGFGRTSSEAVADLVRRDPSAIGLPLVMLAKNALLPPLTPGIAMLRDRKRGTL